MKKKKETKRTLERKHSVEAALNVLELSKAKSALTLKVRARKEIIGTIDIGRGGIIWRGKNKQNHKRMSWTAFADMMNERSY